MKVIFSVISVLVLSLSLNAQRQHKPLYNLSDPGMKNSGWHFSPGLTYMLPSKFSQTVTNESQPGFEDNLTARGRLGFYAEVGRHHLFDQFYFLNHLDYGLAWKKLLGRESRLIDCDECDAIERTAIFKEHFASAYINFSNIYQISDYNFIQNGIGINADYALIRNQEITPENAVFPDVKPQEFQLQLHYKLGFGMKAEKGVFIIPSIEVPILNIVPFEDFKSTLPYFGSRYRPLIFSVKFMFLSERKPEDCKGLGSGKNGHNLWGKKRKR